MTRAFGLLLPLFLFFAPFCARAQKRSAYTDSMLSNPAFLKVNCGIDGMLIELRKRPDFAAIEKHANEVILKKVLDTGSTTDTAVLPLVFHIINTNPSAITDQAIINAVKDLNDAFSKSGNYAASKGIDTKIRFKLAQKDPNGGNTSGINRVKSYYTANMNMAIEDARLKNLIQWDPNKYINIWVINNIVSEISATFSCGQWTRSNAGGYATIPVAGTVATPSDGIVVTGFGVVLAHEMGHYLSLYHTFEGGCTNNNCLTDGDRVCDTPPDGTTVSSPSCDKPTNSCGTDTLSNYSNGFFKKDTTDQIANFMDYGNTTCSNQFTQGQADRMHAAITTLRTGLSKDVLTSPCSENIKASFTRNIDYPIAGDQVIFTNTSTGATNFKWLVNGTQVAATQQLTQTFPAVGKTKVTLIAYNNDANCFAAYDDYVITNCGVVARYSNNKKLIASKTNVLNDTILFTNNSVGATSYQWILSNSDLTGRNLVTSNAAGGNPGDLNYIFPAPGNYQVRLIAQSGACADSTDAQVITVADPTPDAYISIIAANCYQQTKIRVQFYVCNFGYAKMPAKTPVTFYDADPRLGLAHKIDQTFLVPDSIAGFCCGFVYTQILDVTYPRLNQLYAVISDSGTTMPLKLPNASLVEKDYTNNVAVFNNIRFRVTPVPSSATIRQGDTLKLSAQTSPDFTGSSTFVWSSASKLTCTTCQSPQFITDTSTANSISKTVIATSFYQCYDTATVNIIVNPLDDFKISVTNTTCSPKEDSLYVDFTLNNLTTTSGIPKNLLVSFYKNDPSTASAVLIAPVFKVPADITAAQQNYRCKIKKVIGATLFASVNDNGTKIPVSPSNTTLREKNYSNNITGFSYQPIAVTIDTAICGGLTFAGYSASGTYVDNLVTTGGCDSIRTIHLTVKSVAVTRTTVKTTICSGENYAGHTATGTYVDVYTGSNTCDSIRTLNLTVNPVVRKTYNAAICKGQSYKAGGAMQTKSGTYVDTARSYLGCDSITTVNLTVNALPSYFLPNDTSICFNKNLTINLSGYSSVSWNTGATTNAITITQAGSYSAVVIDANGCSGADTINVLFAKCIPIQIPNAFSPNYDGKNDNFRPLIGAPITNYLMQIWNRWGQLLYETRNYLQGWNGRYQGQIQENGTYIYHISFIDPDGVAVSKNGTFVLIK